MTVPNEEVCYDGELTREEMQFLLAKVSKMAGWDDPAMDVYDNYDVEWAKLCKEREQGKKP